MISSLRLQNFRSYTDDSFEFDNGVNIIVGPNASGKTNLLEAILVVCRGGSYRAHDTELIQFDQPWARLDVTNEEGEQRVVKIIGQPTGKTEKEFSVDNHTFKRLSLQRTLPTVLFEPNHLRLLGGSPERRRDYLDGLLEQLTPGFSTLRRQYRRALVQRNSLLKQGRKAGDQLFAWNIRLSELGGQLALDRMHLVEKLNHQLSQSYSRLAQRDTKVDLSYQTSVSQDQYSSDMLYKLELSQEQDLERGFTTYGPHRDDMSISLNDHAAQETASRGETRTLLLALKLSELTLLELQRGQPPLLLLDDVFSELDGARRRALTEVLQTHQTFITTTDADVVIQHFTEACNIIALNTTPSR